MTNRIFPKLLFGAVAMIGFASAQDISCNFAPTATTATATEQATLLSEHNRIRQASGVTNNLVWDDNLAKYAQGFADALAAFNAKGTTNAFTGWPHSPNSCYGTTYAATSGAKGENIGGGNGTALSAVQSYAAEQPNFSLSTMTCNPGTICDHWVQVVSTKVTKVGCGNNKNSGWVCNYDVIAAQKCGGGKYAEFLKPVPVFKVGDRVEVKSLMTGTWRPATVTAVTSGRLSLDFGGGSTGASSQPTGCPTDSIRAATN
jgi:pathogenesis-related protein 1